MVIVMPSNTYPIFTFSSICAAISLLAANETNAQDCPDFAVSATRDYQLSAGDLSARTRIDILAGGGLDLSQCLSAPGRGYVQREPDVRIGYDSEDESRRLDIGIEGDCDTVILVNMPDGTYKFLDDNDEQGTLHPTMPLESAPSGNYDIWIGTYEAETCPATLTLQTFD